MALELSRALARAGASVCTVDTYPVTICGASNSVARSHRIASPREDLGRYQEDILRIVRFEKIDTIVPAGEDALYLADFAAELGGLCETFFSDAQLLRRVHHKQAFNEFARSLGLPVPRSVLYRGPDDLPDFVGRDYILKRGYSRGGDGVIFASGGSLPSTYGVEPDGSWLVQERLAGQTVCSCSVVREGKVVEHVAYLPSVILGSTGVVFRRIEQPAVRAWVEDFVRQTGYHGMISFDFIADGEGNVAAVECNPRPTSGVHLLDPLSLGIAITGAARPRPLGDGRERATLSLGAWIAVPRLIRDGPERRHGLAEIAKGRDVVFSWRDPLPSLHQLPCFVYMLHRAFRTRLPLAAVMFEGAQWSDSTSR